MTWYGSIQAAPASIDSPPAATAAAAAAKLLPTIIPRSQLCPQNPTDERIAFKVKTTAPTRYTVRLFCSSWSRAPALEPDLCRLSAAACPFAQHPPSGAWVAATNFAIHQRMLLMPCPAGQAGIRLPRWRLQRTAGGGHGGTQGAPAQPGRLQGQRVIRAGVVSQILEVPRCSNANRGMAHVIAAAQY